MDYDALWIDVCKKISGKVGWWDVEGRRTGSSLPAVFVFCERVNAP